MRIALGLEYDGSRFLGWQTQPGGGTVQDALESALAAIAGTPIDVVAAGRTDRGVHALEQIVHFDTLAVRPEQAWIRGVNTALEGAAVLWSHPVPDAFHARFSARARTYRYILIHRAVRPAVGSDLVGWHHTRLEVDRMRDAARHLVGEHDFSAFRSSQCQARSPVRTVHSLELHAAGDRIDIVVRANAFLHHMVRNLVGALVTVGNGRQPPAWLAEVLRSRDRAQSAPTFEASGLYLESVEYEPVWGLPGRSRPVPFIGAL